MRAKLKSIHTLQGIHNLHDVLNALNVAGFGQISGNDLSEFVFGKSQGHARMDFSLFRQIEKLSDCSALVASRWNQVVEASAHFQYLGH